ncbi:MAG: VWA domain-containing protein [Holophagales bacterium]|nr:VWA domain-containing protein [Holophagales bacterium]MYF96785.1 VWA domain-containing protein [Holophagales bacterium]
MQATPSPPAWTNAIRTTTPVVLALAIWLQAIHSAWPQPAPVSSDAFPYGEETYDGVSLTPLLGPWIRNEGLSEDPVQKTASLYPGNNYAARLLRRLARDAADRFDTFLIRVKDGSLAILDGRGSLRWYPLDVGQYHRHPKKIEGRILDLDESPEIETSDSEWRRVETLRRDGDRLVRMAEFRGRTTAGVKFRTVYERPERVFGSSPADIRGPQPLARPVALQIVPPLGRYGELLSGRLELQTLVIDPQIATVDFFVDGQLVGQVKKRPFATHLKLANPPREQRLEVRAWGPVGEFIASDTVVLNRLHRPFSARITKIRPAHSGENAPIRVEAAVSLPRDAVLERIDFYRSDELVSTLDDFAEQAALRATGTAHIGALIADIDANDFVRVNARLADGREREDAELLQGADYQSEIDVQLTQIQVLVTDRRGNPVSGLAPSDFEVRENGQQRPVETVHTARDVPLVLGLAIDSSDSVLPIWRELHAIAANFLEAILAPEDRAFIVDFDDVVRLLQPLSQEKELLSRALGRLTPWGGTAVNDGLLFSLLQYGREPGRRALVVITDGLDIHSRTRPGQSADYAQRLGLPIYFIELAQSEETYTVHDPFAWGARRVEREASGRLRRISRQTGGRVFPVRLLDDDPPWVERIEQAFDQIEEDLRHQQVLTYYSDRPLGTAVEPEIRVTRRDLRLRSAVPLAGIE